MPAAALLTVIPNPAAQSADGGEGSAFRSYLMIVRSVRHAFVAVKPHPRKPINTF